MVNIRLTALKYCLEYAAVNISEPHGQNDGAQVNKFQRLLGLREGNAQTTGDPWCVAMHVFAIAKAMATRIGHGYDLADLAVALDAAVAEQYIARSGSCTEEMNWAKPKGLWIPKTSLGSVKPGYAVVYDWDNPNTRDNRHWGVIESVKDGSINTVEGNFGNKVARHTRTLEDVLGFIVIKD